MRLFVPQNICDLEKNMECWRKLGNAMLEGKNVMLEKARKYVGES